jgi:hypothetical protein
MSKRHLTLSVVAFCVFAAIGPILQDIIWRSATVPNAVYHALSAIWPARFLAAGGPAGNIHDIVMTITVNVIFFAIWGLVIGFFRRPTTVWLGYGTVCALVLLVEAWGSGYDLHYFSWLSVIIALLAYLFPFSLVAWDCGRRGAPDS